MSDTPQSEIVAEAQELIDEAKETFREMVIESPVVELIRDTGYLITSSLKALLFGGHDD